VELLDLDRAATRRRDRENGWCILRTNSRSTLRLAQSLNDGGIEAWTPRGVHKRRISRIHMGFREVDQPIIPSFVFARACHLPDLLRALALPTSPHPSFSIFQYAGRAPVIADASLAKLRAAEEKDKRERRKKQRRVVAVGEAVQPRSGAFAGLDGVIVELKGKVAVVNFGGNILFGVETWLLIDDEAEAA
jgi:transcription antitermination factor NusG